MARQASADRAWAAISRFLSNCKKKIPGKKGFPKFKKRGHSVEYKTTGWKLSSNRKYLTLTDGFGIGKLKLIGTYDLHYYQINQIKRLRLVRRADGYYAQFCVEAERRIETKPTKKVLALDVGLAHFYTDSNGEKVDNPKFLRKTEKTLKRLQKQVSRKFAKPKNKGDRQSNNYKKTKQKLAQKHLKVSRQRKDFAVKLARCVIQSNDLVAYEDLQVARVGGGIIPPPNSHRNMVKNHNRPQQCFLEVTSRKAAGAKSISDAAWYQFRCWLEYFAKVYGKITVAVPPRYTSINCSACGNQVKKSLSTRTHKCSCGAELCRDTNAALNILAKALSTTGHVGINAWGGVFAEE